LDTTVILTLNAVPEEMSYRTLAILSDPTFSVQELCDQLTRCDQLTPAGLSAEKAILAG